MPIYEMPDEFIPEDKAALTRLEEELRFRGYSERTQESYLTHVRRFLASLYFDGEESTNGIRNYFLHCRDELGYSPNYANQAMSALKFFYRYIRPDHVSLTRFPTVRRPRQLPDVLSRMEVASLFAHTADLQYRAILMLIYGAGLRVSEVVRIRPRDLDEANRSLRVAWGKGGTDRFTLLSPIALREIREHWAYAPLDQWVFPGGTKRGHISKRSVQRAFEDARDKAGIQKKVGAHVLRHSFATHLLERGTPLLYLQNFLGHKSPVSTLRYIHVTQKELARIKSPLDDLMENGAGGKVNDSSQLSLRLEPDQEARKNGQFALASDSLSNFAGRWPR